MVVLLFRGICRLDMKLPVSRRYSINQRETCWSGQRLPIFIKDESRLVTSPSTKQAGTGRHLFLPVCRPM